MDFPDSVIARMEFDADMLMATLVAVFMTGMTQHKNLLLIALVIFVVLLPIYQGDIQYDAATICGIL